MGMVFSDPTTEPNTRAESRLILFPPQVAANPSSVGGDLSKGFLTGGVSGGGNVTNIATILARDDALQPALTGHLYVCTGMPFQLPNASGDGFAINLFPDKLANGGSWETYKNGPVASRSMNEFYGGLDFLPRRVICAP